MAIEKAEVLMNITDTKTSFAEVAEGLGIERKQYAELRPIIDELIVDQFICRGYTGAKETYVITDAGKIKLAELLTEEKPVKEKKAKNDVNAGGNKVGSDNDVKGVQPDGKSGDGQAHAADAKPAIAANNPPVVDVSGKTANATNTNDRSAADVAKPKPIAQIRKSSPVPTKPVTAAIGGAKDGGAVSTPAKPAADGKAGEPGKQPS